MSEAVKTRPGRFEAWLARSPLHADLVLLVVCLVWGTTFVVVKVGLVDTPPLSFVATRFGIAFLVLLILAAPRLPDLSGPELRRGALMGILLVAGYATQTVGLRLTTASNAGFITGLSVVLVPLFARFVLGHRVGWGVGGGAALAAAGLGLLTLTADLRPEPGDLWVLACAFAFAGHILAVAQLSRGCDALRLAVVQTGVVALGGGVLGLTFEAGLTVPVGTGLFAALYTGILATAVVLGLQIPAQRHTSPSHAAIIFSAEPVFAALFASAGLGETVGPKELLGGGFIVAGMLLAELRRQPGKNPGRPAAFGAGRRPGPWK